MNNGDFADFLTALGAFESGIDTTQPQSSSWMHYLRVFDPAYGNVSPASVDLNNPNDLEMLQYHVHNTLGFMGKYQFGEPLLIDLGYYTPAATGYYGTTATNEWQGTWTGKNGVHSKADFMSTVQELAIREAFSMNMGIINSYLAQAGKSIDDYLGQEFTYTRLGETHVAHVTMSGILASAHLQGPGGVAQLFLHHVASSDEYGTNILFYMDKYSDYTTPFGASGNDFLSGSEYSETFMGGAGHNVYQTGDGHDKIIITNHAENHDIIEDFDVVKDVISLTEFPGITFQQLHLSTLDNQTHITFPNGQTLSLLGVDANELTAKQFVYGPYKITWNANSGDHIIDNFNATYDVIDLNYAFSSNNLRLYEGSGDTILEVIGNNQRIILQNTTMSDLSPANFIKAPVDFATAVFGVETSGTPPTDPHTPPSENEPDNPLPETPPASNNGHIFSYTWNWGAREVIQQFNTSTDQIDLKNFWTSFHDITIYNNAQGHAVIDLSALNNQSIVLEGVTVNQLSTSNFIGVSGTFSSGQTTTPPQENPITPEPEPEPSTPAPETSPPTTGTEAGQTYAYTWNWGNHAIIHQFDVSKDMINLQSFWTSYDAISIHNNAQGDAVIDLSNLNNQTITLQGVSSTALAAENFVGISGNIQQAWSTIATPDLPPTPGVPDNDPSPSHEVVTHAMSSDHLNGSDAVTEVFQFTWAWGSNRVISGFNPLEDKVDLTQFWTSRAQVDIHNDAQGNAVIDLTALNNQTITLLGVSSEQLDQGNVLV